MEGGVGGGTYSEHVFHLGHLTHSGSLLPLDVCRRLHTILHFYLTLETAR